MYGIKRNIKMNTKIIGTANKVAPIVVKKSCELKSNGFGKYKFPVCEEISSGRYFSKITAAKHTTTKSGKKAIEVLYEIKDGVTCYKIVNGLLPEDTENKPYYIKQVYPKGTVYYDEFVDSMAKALNRDNFDVDNVIGVTEYITLSYNKNDIGGISERFPFEMEDFSVQTEQEDNDEVI